MTIEKYYTPKIEEFHIGFEYEIFDNNEWKKIKILPHYIGGDLRIDVPNLGHHDVPYKPRVKYLDKEDIESLGFKETKTKNFFELDNKKESYLSWYPEVNRVEIGDNECSGGFSGIIKNKSELVKLLKQLEI